jgi:glucose 1-dehydrogenase
MTKSLDAKIAIVTGSDSGIGRATAVEFAKEGADVAVTWFQDGDGAEETRRQVEAQGRRAIGVRHPRHGSNSSRNHRPQALPRLDHRLNQLHEYR